MTDAVLPPMPSDPPPPPPSEAPKKSRIIAVIIGSAAAVIAAVVVTGIVVVQAEKDDNKPAATAEKSAPKAEPAIEATEDTEPTYTDLDADSFTIDLKTKSRQCFGSAGCNLTVEPSLSLAVDSEDVDPDATYEITYEIRGDESGPVIETAELTEQTSLSYTPSSISTVSARTKVSVKITDVQKQ
ncbi:hypothetical protein ACIOTI_08815 [Streptomyces sp. NPDC087843]|uniref:hypothetical protein n=1 Tax=Streptomyces sp. NPDC087843 TaxID=3365804 RepID=UPI0037FA2599